MCPAADLLTPFEWTFTQVRPDTVGTEVDAGSAVFAGHFPGQPTLPAVCLIDLVCRVAGESGPALDIARARFVDAVRPGDQLEVTVTAHPDGEQLVGEVRRSGQLVCQVRLRAS